MTTTLVTLFVLCYLAIAMEHPLQVNKSASALIGAGLLWTIYAVGLGDPHAVGEQLGESLMGTAQIVFFLMGAMTIVEVVDAHNGFGVVTSRIKTTRLASLMWLIAGVTFVLSAILDNLTTTIVMVSLLRKLLARHEDRLLLAGIIVIAANSGGAWSPIGDVTTTMLWIGGQVSSLGIIQALWLPSLVSMLVPLGVTAWLLRGREVEAPASSALDAPHQSSAFERKLMFFLGLAILVAVPAFKTLTHLPPFMGILLGLGVLWLVGDLLHRHKDEEDKQRLTLTHALSKIDMASLLFFVGILLAVATLEHTHVLRALAGWLDTTVGRQDLIVLIIGIASAIVDNVPLVAASMGMYSLATYPTDHFLWEFLAYCAGTGGSILIIGSAAGVAAMGLERIQFGWYLKNISALALLGYLAGAGTYLVQHRLLS
ncbi:MAG: sodium:proton antiporter NhaD [Burkholderiales bacterium]|nr:sodium:proton antiporter NhaD [Burkholderiales bacterium]